MQPSCGTHSFEFNQRLHVSFPGGSVDKNLPANTGDMGSIPGLRRSPGEGNGNPLQYSCLKNLMDRGAWQATVHRITKSQTWLKWLSKHACMMQPDILCSIYSILLYSFLLKYSWFTISCSCRCTAQSFNFTHTHTHTHIHMCIHTHTHSFSDSFPNRLLQNIEYGSVL